MALAYLCKQLELRKLVDDDAGGGDGFTVRAFVVDHKAREESTREARAVAGWLAELGKGMHLFFFVSILIYLIFCIID